MPIFRHLPLLFPSAVVCLTVLMSASWRRGSEAPMQLLQLNTGWITQGADVSPDSRFVTVVARKGPETQHRFESTEELQVWQSRDGKLAARDVLHRELFESLEDYNKRFDRTPAIVRYSADGSKLVVYRSGHLLTYSPDSLTRLQDMDLGASAWPRFPPTISREAAYVRAMELDQQARRAGIVITPGPGGGCDLRVYDLGRHALMRKWEFNYGKTLECASISLDPDGRLLAIPLQPFVPGERTLRRDERDVKVLNIDTGDVVAEINTDYLAAQVCFAPGEPLVLLTVSGDDTNPSRNAKDTIKIWNPRSGKLLREISNSPEGVHSVVGCSADGRTVLGYTGLQRREGHWWLLQEEYLLKEYDMFRLWDLATGKVIASSPQIRPPSRDFHLRLSAKGDLVLVYPVGNATPLALYEIR